MEEYWSSIENLGGVEGQLKNSSKAGLRSERERAKKDTQKIRIIEFVVESENGLRAEFEDKSV